MLKYLRMKLILMVVLASSFAWGQDTIKPTSYYWGRLDAVRQLGYVEGFNAGVLSPFNSNCKLYPLLNKTPHCILAAWQRDTMVDINATATLETITKLYADPKNEPLRWDTAVIIAEAMVSGVAINEADLNIVREFDAKLK
jgi:hypothetical protein